MKFSRHRSSLVLLFGILIAWSLCILWHSTEHSHDTTTTTTMSADSFLSSDTSLFDAVALAETWTNKTNRYLPSLRAMKFANEFVECRGKERLIDMLLEAFSSPLQQQDNDDDNDDLFASRKRILETCTSLPTIHQITSIYGKGPVIVGLETCQAYRDLMAQNRLMDPMPRVAGLYHSGTNALSKTLELNLGLLHYYSQWNPYEVPWGKHVPASYRFINKFPPENPDSPEHVLPIVIVRDPFDWMRNMCKEGYDAKFLKRPKFNCPHLFRMGSSAITNKVHVSAHQTGFQYTDYYESLAAMYTEWHRQYLNATFPRLLIRYEDLVLYPQQLVQAIAKCSGKAAKPTFQYYSNEARQFVKDNQSTKQSQQSLLKALKKLGERDTMYWTLQEPSRSYALRALDPEILELFQYQHLNDVNIPATRPPIARTSIARTTFGLRKKRTTLTAASEQNPLRRFASQTMSSLLTWLVPGSATSSTATKPTSHRPPVSPTSKEELEARYKAMLANRKAREEGRVRERDSPPRQRSNELTTALPREVNEKDIQNYQIRISHPAGGQ